MKLTQQLVSLQTVVRKEMSRVLRIWIQTFVPPVITMSLYFIIFGNLIGRRIGQMDGFDYMQYIAPGLIMMSVIQNSYGNVVSSFFGAKFQKHLEEMLVSPMPTYAIIIGHVAGGVFRGLLVGSIVTVIALFFTKLQIANIFVTISIVILTAIVFALGGLINAIFARKFDDISIIPAFVLAPLTYLGGIFYSISLLPEFAQKLSLFNPILYMVNAFRYGMLGVSDIDIRVAYGITLIFIAILFSVSMFLMDRGIGIRE
ncbi:MAG: ABC transporter permease [Gammaproteobacteria bacterium]|jgi:ABC-2 type transport system permease protein|nr:ABC transporter permease [Chromatiales bacterium]MDP6673422.1 ABC transporter permease [Gammaproteobacteria bacterium]